MPCRVKLCGENRQPRPSCAGALDDSAAQDPFAVVEDERLTGRNRGYRLVERELDLVVLEADDLGRGGRRAVPNLHGDARPGA
jgi:hypothetical protein